ncbi:hypothetical protein BDZ89DRAFT_154085 [Hymenopellis radicata]|nr:hypothetical protein BDZ89DRAFT_154085 [Hymenopellis radicata]
MISRHREPFIPIRRPLGRTSLSFVSWYLLRYVNHKTSIQTSHCDRVLRSFPRALRVLRNVLHVRVRVEWGLSVIKPNMLRVMDLDTGSEEILYRLWAVYQIAEKGVIFIPKNATYVIRILLYLSNASFYLKLASVWPMSSALWRRSSLLPYDEMSSSSSFASAAEEATTFNNEDLGIRGFEASTLHAMAKSYHKL